MDNIADIGRQSLSTPKERSPKSTLISKSRSRSITVADASTQVSPGDLLNIHKFEPGRQRSLSFKLDEELPHAMMIRLKRAAYTYDEIERTYQQLEQEKEPPWQYPTMEEIIPAIGYARTYNCNSHFYPDVCSGLAVACLHIPQGLAYGLLANLTPISGVYTSLFSVLVYVVFGTVPHISMGTNAVLSLITAAMVEREADKFFNGDNKNINVTKPKPDQISTVAVLSDDVESEERMNFKLGVAMTSTFVCGLILLLMGLLRMGFLTNYMPSSFVSSFTSAAALHIAMSQMKHVFHIKVPVHSGFGKLVYTAGDVIKGLRDMNLADTAVCFLSVWLLLLMDRLLNPMMKMRFGAALPSNLLLVLTASAVSYLLNLHAEWGISIVGHIDSGLPLPGLPMTKFSVVTGVLYDSIVQAVIVFTMSISMAMLMAKLHNYELDSNRELVAYGMCNLFSSFFNVQSSSVSPPRTLILSNSGAKTTFNGLSTVALLLGGVTFLGPLFQPVPLASLAAMIIVAVLDVLLQVRHVPRIWKVSRTDFAVWCSTWVSTVLGDLEYGICIGVLVAALGFMVNNQYIKGELVVRSTREDLLVPGLGRAWTRHLKRTRIFYFPSQLFFANAESFKKQLYGQVFDPTAIGSLSYTVSARNDNLISNEDSAIDTIILDCSAMTYVDIDGLTMLKTVIIHYHNVGVQVMLARCPHTIMPTLEQGDLFSVMPRHLVFHEVVDALARETDLNTHGDSATSFNSTVITPSLRRVSSASLITQGRSTSIY